MLQYLMSWLILKMTSPFKIKIPLILPDSSSYVTWSPEVKKFVYSHTLMDVLFEVIKCEEFGFGICLNSGEVEPLWINKKAWIQDESKTYSLYVQGMYNVIGILFKDHAKAVQFHDWLEKKYMWESLSV